MQVVQEYEGFGTAGETWQGINCIPRPKKKIISAKTRERIIFLCGPIKIILI